MHCIYCGQPVPAGGSFCVKCGKPQPPSAGMPPAPPPNPPVYMPPSYPVAGAPVVPPAPPRAVPGAPPVATAPPPPPPDPFNTPRPMMVKPRKRSKLPLVLILLALLGAGGFYGLRYVNVDPLELIASFRGGGIAGGADPSGHTVNLLGEARLTVLEGDAYIVADGTVWRSFADDSREPLGVTGARSVLAGAGSVWIAGENAVYRYQPSVRQLSKLYDGGVRSFALAAPYLMVSDHRGALTRVHIPSLETAAFAPDGTAEELAAVGEQLLFREFEGDGVFSVSAMAAPGDFNAKELESGVIQAAVSGDLLYLATSGGVAALNRDLKEDDSFDSAVPEGAFFAGGYWYYQSEDGIARMKNGGKEELLPEDGGGLLGADGEYLLTDTALLRVDGKNTEEVLLLEDVTGASPGVPEEEDAGTGPSGEEASDADRTEDNRSANSLSDGDRSSGEAPSENAESEGAVTAEAEMAEAFA